jgi:hypothetical protein
MTTGSLGREISDVSPQLAQSFWILPIQLTVMLVTILCEEGKQQPGPGVQLAQCSLQISGAAVVTHGSNHLQKAKLI